LKPGELKNFKKLYFKRKEIIISSLILQQNSPFAFRGGNEIPA